MSRKRNYCTVKTENNLLFSQHKALLREGKSERKEEDNRIIYRVFGGAGVRCPVASRETVRKTYNTISKQKTRTFRRYGLSTIGLSGRRPLVT